MRVALRDGTRIFFEVIGTKLVPEGPTMRERPTMLLLHGGPGCDHSGLAHTLAPLCDVAQLVVPDHRGQGRSTTTAARVAAQTAAIRPADRVLSLTSAKIQPGLEADEQEDGVLEDEGDGAPVHPFGDARLRGLQDRRLVPEQQAGDDDRDDPRGVDLLGGDEGRERDDERDRRCRAPGR